VPGQVGEKLVAAIDPRRRIYRDSFNEQFVFILSASGAAVLVPLILLLVGVFVGDLSVGGFVAASVGLELFLIFGIGRPQMKAHERVGWALLWGSSAALFGLLFYYLVFEAAV
jgi:hypothetical protein